MSPTNRTLPCASIGNGGSFIGTPLASLIPQPQGNEPSLSAAASSPVRTAMTPGEASAALLSMPRSTACPCGERTNTPAAMPGRLMSET